MPRRHGLHWTYAGIHPAFIDLYLEEEAVFEHKVLKFTWGWKGFDYAKIEQELNELGAQGWEAVGTIVPSVGAGQSIEIGIIVKRERNG
ncbi:DUF4177 domain-containing protein [Pseudonocardia sp. NPDC046786]|uniref:DUF4177 domain-containing protein n=1 Tax=Pseudonocardia sp. NPDC046786 TaxID=3155471 RepID=UPI0033EDCE81